MISDQDLKVIRKELETAENPMFFFDDDPDGLCSYLLLKRFVKRGKGVVVKCSPKLDPMYLRKVKEYCPDKVFILDKPLVSEEFLEGVNVPIFWIDHHAPQDVQGVKYFNPRIENDADNRPTSYWCYRIVEQDLWLAMCGIIGDWYIPEFTDEFKELYPGLLGDIKDAGDALFNSDFGKLTRVLDFILKGRVSDVNKSISVLEKIENPYEILNKETAKGRYLYKYFEKVNKGYVKLIADAKKSVTKSKVLLYTYPSTKHSFTGTLSNELLHLYPKKLILIGREKEDRMIISLRSSKIEIPPILEKALEGLDGYGGGHTFACGSNVSKEDFPEFLERVEGFIK